MLASERDGAWCCQLSGERACVKSNWWFILLSLGRLPQGTWPPLGLVGTVFVGPLLLDDLGMRRKLGWCVRTQGYRTVLLVVISAFLSSSRCTYFCFVFYWDGWAVGGEGWAWWRNGVWGRTGVWYPAGWYIACHRMVPCGRWEAWGVGGVIMGWRYLVWSICSAADSALVLLARGGSGLASESV